MKKSFTILMALVITFFTVPFGGITALADEKVYDDIENGEYDIIAKALHSDKDEASGAASFINEEATLSVQDGEVKLTITVPHNEMAEIEGLQIEGKEPVKNGEDWTYQLDPFKIELDAQVQYAVPMFDMKHDVPFRFILEGLDDITVKEPEQPEPAPEERVVGPQIMEFEADAVYELKYETDSSATKGNLLNPVKLLEKDDKQYIQIPINEGGANFFRSLEINGKQVTWNSITEGPYTIQFELPGKLKDRLTLDMVIQAGPRVMVHDGIKVWFNTDTLKQINSEPEKIEVKRNEKISVKAKDTIIFKNNQNTQLMMPNYLPVNTKVTIIPKTKEQIKSQKDLKIAGDILEFNFENLGENLGEFELVMGYNADEYDTDQVDIYYYDEEKEEWIKQGGIVENGTITINPTHFSTYGVFATESEDGSEGNVDKESKELDYVVKHATEDKTSSADSFFTKPAHLIERDGETYIQLTIKSWGMIDWLRTEHGDVTIIEENADTAIVEFKVTGELSDAINLSMQVTVPGLYEMEHNVRLFLDVIEENDTGNEEKEPGDGEKETGNKEKENNQSTSDEKTEVVPEAAYTINYVVKHATEDRTSAADSFFVKPAYLLYGEDGTKYIQLIINDWDMIDWLRTEHGDVIVVKENADGSALIQFKVVGELSDEVLLSMSVTVPGLYSMEHDARLIFDVDSQNEVDPNEFQIIVDSADPQGPGKPNFGNGDSNTDNGNEKATNSGNNNNPQTGDTTNIFLYVMLLMGSLIPLAVKLRRRFV